MNSIVERLSLANEPFAAGFFEDSDVSNFIRFSRATLRYREACSLPAYSGEDIYPNGKRSIDDYTVMPHFSYTYMIEGGTLKEREPELYDYCLIYF